MNPPGGHVDSVAEFVDQMVSPDLGGEPTAREAEAAEAEATPEEVVEPVAETAEPEDQPEEEEAPPEADESEPEGDDEDYEDDEPAAPTTGLHTVKVNGEEVQVDMDELKRGYSGQQYVQKGMQEVAAARKQTEEIYNALQAERQQVASFVQNLQQGIKPPPVEPDKALFESDPISYMEQKIRYDEEAAAYQSQMQELEGVAHQQSEADQRAVQTYLQGELEQLQAVDPDFRERETAEKARGEMVDIGESVYGYKPDEIGQIMDHRAIRVLRDAVRYQQIIAGKQKSQEQAKEGKGPLKTVKKGKPVKRATTRSSRRRKQKDRLKSTGSIDDALNLMFE